MAKRHSLAKKLAADERAEELWRRMKPQVVETLEKHSPERADLKFNEIEGNAAGVGDMIARLLIQEALKVRAAASDQDVQAARQQMTEKARAIGKTPEDLRLTRQPDKPCELKTVRGPVPVKREYLYFPELNQGIFPPRPTP